jgi:hypothetical protein
MRPSAGGLWILLAALAFLVVFAALSAALVRAGWTVPSGVLAATAVTFVVPAAIGALRLVGFWRASGLAPLREYEGPLVLVAGFVASAVVLRRAAWASSASPAPSPPPRTTSARGSGLSGQRSRSRCSASRSSPRGSPFGSRRIRGLTPSVAMDSLAML